VCVWLGTSLTKEQLKKLENIRCHAVQIVVGNIPYEEACCLLNFPSLAERRLSMRETLLKQIVCESDILYYLLPAKRDTKLTCRMRLMNKYPTVHVWTNQMFVLHALSRCHMQASVYACVCYVGLFVLHECFHCLLMQPLAAKFK